jgi:hypothetical protein
MNKKVLYAILNYNRDPKLVMEIVENLPKDSHIVLATNQKNRFNDYKNKFKNILNIKGDKNISSSKNKLLRYSKNEGYEYCFIIEDDLIIKDNSAFEKYINLMERFEIKYCFYGFDNRNIVLDGKKNPCMEIKLGEDDYLHICRYPCSTLLCFKIEKNMPLFNESIYSLENEEITQRLKDAGFINFNGFFIDLFESWKYFGRSDVPREKNISDEIGKRDMKILNSYITFDTNSQEFLDYIKSKLT